MNKSIFYKKLNIITNVLLIVILLLPYVALAQLTASSVVSVSARVVDPNEIINIVSDGYVLLPNSQTNDKVVITTIVNLSGIATPFAKVSVLKDGKIVATTYADKNAQFAVSLYGLKTEVYTISLFGQDNKNVRSASEVFSILIKEGTVFDINNILLSPTINISSNKINQGDNFNIFGQTAPNSKVIISVIDENEKVYEISSNEDGLYSYNLNTDNFNFGNYQIRTKTMFNNQTSSFNLSLPFSITFNNNEFVGEFCLTKRSDLNCDKFINLLDFYIMKLWYKKNNFPKKFDLNNDRVINLSDFSIMAFNWTK